MDDLELSRLRVLVERHLALESQLADALDEMNRSAADAFQSAGIRGPSQKDVQGLGAGMEELQQKSAELTQARADLLQRINECLDSQFTRIKQFIAILPRVERDRLTGLRRDILSRCSGAQSKLIQNQAVLFYTFDFHRKYLAGVLQSDSTQGNYNADGHSSSVGPGNILGKAC